MSDRRAELAAGLARVHERVDAALSAAGRTDAPTLVVVTKRFPTSDLDLLVDLGVTDIGENRDQEAAAKLPEVAARSGLTVHFVGQVQTRKAGSVARYADVVHSLDREKLARALDRAAEREGRAIEVLLQVGLDTAGGRGGAPAADVPALADLVAGLEHLRLRGVMAVAPRCEPPRPAFARLRELSERLRSAHPGATAISAGMSGDLEDAVAEGATHLRVGSAILGSRESHG
ncbi:YggS family pyridoxal phosphate-dependent enzyme [Phycicoccus sp. CSK15P-2]|uniref:YggS family pyridoxal phosphate-dependent enzyme n=1 Tax=Phycicoccus sp. CSK15P-2 TaxID=2807627 RepID=UPI00194EDAEE|nr:YggS family pyridoxal phosphate-dependent enzyme [Phycicoccus sp. CSK15P-2]MBM6404112.1 YggS family pyridoxal phosphate-dependent enzyme [Phycicoccus sp. CSK15P-2]